MPRKLTKDERDLLDELVGQADIAEMCGVSRSLVSMWIQRHRNTLFPRPVAKVRAAQLFLRSDVQEWFTEVYPAQRKDAGQ